MEIISSNSQAKVPVKEAQTVGMKTSQATTLEHEDPTKHHRSPVVCEEDFFSSDQNLTLSGKLEHEPAVSSGKGTDATMGTDSGKPGKQGEKKWKKKKRKSKGHGYQKGGGQDNAHNKVEKTDCSIPPVNVIRTGGGTQRRQIGNADGEDSGSDEENGQREKVARGHYAGLPQNNEGNRHLKKDQERPVNSNAVATRRLSYQPANLAHERIINAILKRMNSSHSKHARLVAKMIVHCSSCTNEDSCATSAEPQSCQLVKKFIKYAEMSTKPSCHICKVVDCGTLIHATRCDRNDPQDSCDVRNCQYWKQWLKSRHERQVEGKVIHSTTTLWPVGSAVYEDVDYTFLYKAKLGKGGCGDVHRAWFFEFNKEIEADIVLKEVRRDPLDEAYIHGLIRQNHPNLLGAMVVIRFEKPRSINGREIYGYILMERAECTLYDLKMAYRDANECGLPLRDCMFYWYQVLEGLRYLHDKGIVHKDIKDLNMLVFNNYQHVKISDWDMAISLERENTELLQPKGTAGFCAPEVIQRRCHGTPADIFNAGVMLLELRYGGMYPQSKKERTEDIENRRTIALKKLIMEHEELGHLVERCLSENPEERPTAHDLVQNPFLRLEEGYKTNLPPRENSSEKETQIVEMRHLADIDGDIGERVRQKAEEVINSQGIEMMMDSLPKMLPNENIPQSKEWVECAQVSEADEIMATASLESDEGGAGILSQAEPMEVDT